MIYKGNKLKFAPTDLERKIMNLYPRNSEGIFKQIYSKMIPTFVLSYLTVFRIFSVIAYVLQT